MDVSIAADQHLVLRRVERQHALLEHLATRSPRRTTAQDLAHGLGVAIRTIERDVARLRAAGVPISVRGGPGGGYVLTIPPRPQPVQFSRAELAALVVSLLSLGPTASATALTAMTTLVDAMTEQRKDQ